MLQLTGSKLADLARVGYRIDPQPGAASKPVSVGYDIQVLKDRGYFTGGTTGTLPVVGLYANYANHVLITLTFSDGSVGQISTFITTAPYVDPNGIYDRPTILSKRAVGSSLGFDYFALKGNLGAPIIVDTDGNIRWASGNPTPSFSSAFVDNGFLIADQYSPALHRLELDGSVTQAPLVAPANSPGYVNFAHNIDRGKQGWLVEPDTLADGVRNIESTIVEITSAGAVLKQWDLAAIFRDYMQAHGDDPTTFVRPGFDWLHNNGVTYDPRDNSLVVSSREQFLFKIDYDTGALRWILGDPTKYWYSFPSLRAKSLTLPDGSLYPIGQHAPSITPDGLLMIFNDGTGSFSQPAGAPVGQTRTYSAVSAYSIDASTHTAQEALRFDYNQTIYSNICSSVYEASDRSMLIDYATAASGTQARLVGLDANREVVFDFQYANPNSACTTSWNAVIIPFENLQFN